jgi:hypothetical protein
MARPTPSPLDARVRQARRRLFTQTLLNRLGIAWGCALALSLGWFLLEPVVHPGANPTIKWAVLGGLTVSGTALAIWLALRAAPSPLSAALAIDQRFELAERVTTALSLTPHDQSSPAGQALLADANDRLKGVAVPAKFPVRVGWRALFLPAQAVAIALLALYPPPLLTVFAGGTSKPGDEQAKADEKAAQAKPAAPPKLIEVADRKNKSPENRQLEAELQQLYEEHKLDKPNKEKAEESRERQEAVAKLEERLKKREGEMRENLNKLQDQMNKLTGRDKAESPQDGQGKELEKALAQGDREGLKKAQDEAERLEKKAREKKLDPKEQEQLKKQLDDLNGQVEKLTREQKEKEKKLRDLIDQAKRDKRDADALERELKNLLEEQQMTKEMQELAKSLKAAKESLEQNDMDGLADRLGEVGKQLGNIQGELDDLKDLEDHLQNLRDIRKQACKNCEGEKKDGKDPSDQETPGGGRQEGARGKRPENPNALTSAGQEQRVRAPFDPKGRKTFAGSTAGPAFKKASSVEMAGDIKQAVQEAPEAIEQQRLPKAAKDMVKEYFEKLGDQAPKK